jgi:hypothetical protein
MNLKPGTLCVIVGGCPDNIGIVVEVLAHLGPCGGRVDAYRVRTVSGRPFAQLWDESGPKPRLMSNHVVNDCITDRHKLRPLVDPKGEEPARTAKCVKDRKKELATTE